MAEGCCVFCDVVERRAPATRIAENEHALAILDISPLSEGHCLIIPKRHQQFWYDLPEEETAGLFTLAREIAQRIEHVFGADLVTMFARGRRVPHAHLFLVPAHPDDPLERYFHALEGFQEAAPRLTELRTPEAMQRAADKLREG